MLNIIYPQVMGLYGTVFHTVGKLEIWMANGIHNYAPFDRSCVIFTSN